MSDPLSVIAMASRLLNKNLPGGDKDERSAQLLDTLNRNVNRLNALVSRVVQEEANLKTDPDEKLDRHQIKVPLSPLVVPPRNARATT